MDISNTILLLFALPIMFSARTKLSQNSFHKIYGIITSNLYVKIYYIMSAIFQVSSQFSLKKCKLKYENLQLKKLYI